MIWQEAAHPSHPYDQQQVSIDQPNEVQQRCMTWQDAISLAPTPSRRRASASAAGAQPKKKRIIVNDPRELLMSWQDAVRNGPKIERTATAPKITVTNAAGSPPCSPVPANTANSARSSSDSASCSFLRPSSALRMMHGRSRTMG